MLERGIKQLITQALDNKSKVFQTRIEGVVQNYIYTQNHPQRQEKQIRKHKTVDDKDDIKSSSSDTKHDVISDISQLIPIPGPSSTVAKATEAADKKLGVQDTSKSSTSSKGFQTIKKQGKSNTLAGRGEETRTASPVSEKSQSDEGSRSKEGKCKISRVKAESLSRDDGRLSPKVEDNSSKLNKVSRVKVESVNRGESCASSSVEDRSSLSAQDNKASSSGEINENSNQVHPLPVAEETSATQDDVKNLVEVKMEKGNESGNCVSLENKVKESSLEYKVKEKSETFEEDEQGEQKEEVEAGLGLMLMPDCGKQEPESILLNEVSQIDTTLQRSDVFQTAKRVEEMSQGLSRIEEKASLDATISANESEVQEKVENSELVIKKESLVEKVEEIDIKGDEKISEAADSSALEHIGIKTTDFTAIEAGPENIIGELPSDLKSGASPESVTTSNEPQRQTLLEQNQELQSRLEEELVASEHGLEKLSSVASFAKEDVSHTSPTGDYSDDESDVSEVSSVHTSDLSSFDEEISSMSESYDEDEVDEENREEDVAEKPEHRTGDVKETSMSQSQQDVNAAPMRRSTRISSRRSTKEGESEISENETSKRESRDSSRKRRRSEKRNKNPRPTTAKEQGIPGIDKPRRRGRPRKDERRTRSSRSESQMRRSRTHDREDSGTAPERSGSDSRESRSTRSQRQIKRTRCYSPSSEGTREVFLPRKRSRDDPT